ncbi:RNA polymerase sigma factor [uncultured Eubacterium sp.]|uniref:RNA polymerase sigma factor n=1 Tax=uncultured Eubacterium sp. TaxID=165185 RepID=UPI0025942744|nr:sigma-70 family RNA polymerase sigma factor [uncultured Eubacterium sp.]
MDKTYAGMSYEEVVEKYSDYITRMCVVWTQNEEAAKDCFQNTFIKLYKSSKNFNDSEHLKAWLLRVARNECNDYHRTFWNKNVSIGLDREKLERVKNDSVNKIQFDSDTENLVKALRKLSLKYREVLVLYYYQEYSTKEISDILQLSVNTVKSRLQRGREKLAKIIKKQV